MRALLAFLLVFFAFPAAADDFLAVTGPCGLDFPRDHAPHPGYKTEWWYYTAVLTGPQGERYGAQFTLFRSQLKPDAVEDSWPDERSAWRSNQILLGHAAITDVSGRRHVQAERMSRQALNLAGFQAFGQNTAIFLNDWSLDMGPAGHQLAASGPDFSYSLLLTPMGDPVAHGDGGYSRKGVRPESASCYYSIPALALTGEIILDGRTIPVTGQAWMDHEYSSAPLEPGITGWDWFSLRLSDGSSLMAFFLRREDGGVSEASTASLIAPDGSVTAAARRELALTATGTWTSPRSKARYPAGWRLVAPGLELELAPELADQEMNTPGSTGVNYWEGLTRAKGTRNGQPVLGEGYVELTGYDRAFSARY
jgi:predicted secreted hydrolase